MEYLILSLDEHGSTGRWAVFDGDGRLISQAASGPLEEAAEAARNRRLVVLVPALEIVGTEVTLPNASAARLRKMLPFSLEDTLAEDIDNVFFAVGPRTASGAVSVVIVARERLEGWLATLAAAGLTPQAVYSDADGVPGTPGTLTLVIEGERVYGRAAERPPFVFEGLPLAAILDMLETSLGEAKAELAHAVIYVDSAAQEVYEQDLRILPERIASTDVKLMADSAWHRLASTVARRPGVNLLQGAYAPKSNWDALLRPWRFAAGLLLAAGLLVVLGRGVEYFALRHEDNALTAQLAENCARSLGARQLDQCEREVRRRIAASGQTRAGAGAGFLDTLATVAASQHPESRLEALSYRNEVMDLQLVVPDVPALDSFVEDVERSKRYEVNIQSTTPGEDGVEGRVQVVEAAP